MSLADTYRNVRPACVAIALASGDRKTGIRFLSFGSGACIDSGGIVATAKHVITGYFAQVLGDATVPKQLPKESFSILFQRPATNSFELAVAQPVEVLLDQTADLALIRITRLPDAWPAFQLAAEGSVNEGDRVATAGFPLRSWRDANVFPHLFSGIVSQVAGQFLGDRFVVRDLVLDISVHPGNSGGAVFNVHTGELVGIVSSQTLRDLDKISLTALSESLPTAAEQAEWEAKVWTNITHCVPSSVIKVGLEEIRARK